MNNVKDILKSCKETRTEFLRNLCEIKEKYSDQLVKSKYINYLKELNVFYQIYIKSIKPDMSTEYLNEFAKSIDSQIYTIQKTRAKERLVFCLEFNMLVNVHHTKLEVLLSTDNSISEKLFFYGQNLADLLYADSVKTSESQLEVIKKFKEDSPYDVEILNFIDSRASDDKNYMIYETSFEDIYFLNIFADVRRKHDYEIILKEFDYLNENNILENEIIKNYIYLSLNIIYNKKNFLARLF